MALTKDVIEDIQTILKYVSQKDILEHNFQASCDQIWCGKYTADKMSVDEIEKMVSTGWFEDEESWSMLT